MNSPLISFVTHGRNDGFMGDFIWRVSASIRSIFFLEAMTLEPVARLERNPYDPLVDNKFGGWLAAISLKSSTFATTV